MTLVENVKSVYELKQQKEKLEAEVARLQEEIKKIDATIEGQNSSLFEALKSNNIEEFEVDDLFANLFRRETIGYSSDSDVINYLKAHGYSEFVKVKTTESLDKKGLNKELKTNSTLKEELNSLLVTNVSEYVVVTNAENHEKMLEHIKENTK